METKQQYSFKGKLTRPSLDQLTDIWEKVPKGGSFFSKFEGSSLQSFVKTVRESDLFLLYSYGYARVSNLFPNSHCKYHGVLWGKDAFRYSEDVKFDVDMIAHTFDLNRVECVIPDGYKSLGRFLENKLGFEPEQLMLRHYPFHEFTDARVYVKVY